MLDIGTMFVRWTISHHNLVQVHSLQFMTIHGENHQTTSTSNVREHAVNFLKIIPKLPSHYCRKHTKLMYLEPGLTIQNLYQLYKTEDDNDKVRGVSMKILRYFQGVGTWDFSAHAKTNVTPVLALRRVL